MSLVQKFEEKLEVSRKNAIMRIAVLFFLILCFFAAIAYGVMNFPYAGGYAETVDLIPGNPVEVQKILDGEVMVGKPQFLAAVGRNTTFVALGDDTIVYMAKSAGISYRYVQDVPLKRFYFLSSQQIQDGKVVREIHRNMADTIVSSFFFLFLLFALLVFMIFTQTKHKSGWGSDSVYNSVWY